MPRTLCLVEIAEIPGVTHQRTSVIVRQPGFTKLVDREGQSVVHRRVACDAGSAYLPRYHGILRKSETEEHALPGRSRVRGVRRE